MTPDEINKKYNYGSQKNSYKQPRICPRCNTKLKEDSNYCDVCKYEFKINESRRPHRLEYGKNQVEQKNINVPKCPTCGSTNLRRISTSDKIIGAALFGLLSKNAKSQFKCNNCGYKW